MKITTTEQRRLDLFEAGHSIEEIAAAEGATIQSIKTSIWRAKAKREGTYKAPAASTGSSKKKSSGFNFSEEDMEKVNFIKESFKNQYGSDLSDADLIHRALRNLFDETYKYEEILKEKKAKAEREERERKEKAEQERKERQRKSRTKQRFGRMKLKYFTGHEETTQEIKKTYKKWSKQLHPDMPTGNHDAFIILTNEYEYMMAK